LSEGDGIAVRTLVPDEAAQLIELIRLCYGETYIDPSFYREASVSELLASGRLHSIGAFIGTGQLVGHMGISLRAHGGVTADAGMTLVDPAFRGRGIARSVAVGLAQQSMALGLVGVHDYPVTVHAATQRIGAGFGVDTGLMLANMPGDVVFQQMETPAPGSRTSSIIRWLPFGIAQERTVHLPARYQDQIEALYAEACLIREVVQSDEQLAGGATELEQSYNQRRQTLRVAVTRAGDDLARRIDVEVGAAVKQGALVVHVDLMLCDSSAPAATEALRSRGFSLAGLLPEYRDGDVLRLQWLADEVDETAFSVLSTEATQAIAALVLADRRSISG
jgi:hypothetical protein